MRGESSRRMAATNDYWLRQLDHATRVCNEVGEFNVVPRRKELERGDSELGRRKVFTKKLSVMNFP